MSINVNPLSQRETTIVQMIADGRLLKEIADSMNMSVSGTHCCLQRARDRVGTNHTTPSFVATALREGWIR